VSWHGIVRPSSRRSSAGSLASPIGPSTRTA
jgi:hypothetical protein